VKSTHRSAQSCASEPPQSLLTIARGSSDHAAHYMAYLIMARLGRLVTRCRWHPRALGTFGSSTRVVAAGAVLTIAPALIVFFFTQRFFEGAIK
jgi:ABC-type glycerol-3-phosphate transport system permease component